MPKDSEGSTGSSYVVDRKNRKLSIKLMKKNHIRLIGKNITKIMNIENKQIIIFIKQNILLKLKLLIKLKRIILKSQEIMEKN